MLFVGVWRQQVLRLLLRKPCHLAWRPKTKVHISLSMCGRLLVRGAALVAKCLSLAFGDCRLTVLFAKLLKCAEVISRFCARRAARRLWPFLLLVNAGSILPLSAAFWLFDTLYLLRACACGMKGFLKLSSGLGLGSTLH